MKRILNTVLIFVSLIAALATILGVYLQIKKRKIELQVNTISIDKLTKTPAIKDLKATYLFRGDTVGSLWKVHYLITNVGDETIIGEGTRKHLIKEDIKFYFNDGFKILQVQENQNKNIQLSIRKNQLAISFLQWMPEEQMEVVAYLEENRAGSTPKIETDEREIISGEVSYTSIRNPKSETEKRALITRLAGTWRDIIRWFAIICYTLFSIISLVVLGVFVVEFFNFSTWKRKNYSEYEAWMNDLVVKKKISYFREPYELSNSWKNRFKGPEIPDYDGSFLAVSLTTLFSFIFMALPLLFLIQY